MSFEVSALVLDRASCGTSVLQAPGHQFCKLRDISLRFLLDVSFASSRACLCALRDIVHVLDIVRDVVRDISRTFASFMLR